MNVRSTFQWKAGDWVNCQPFANSRLSAGSYSPPACGAGDLQASFMFPLPGSRPRVPVKANRPESPYGRRASRPKEAQASEKGTAQYGDPRGDRRAAEPWRRQRDESAVDPCGARPISSSRASSRSRPTFSAEATMSAGPSRRAHAVTAMGTRTPRSRPRRAGRSQGTPGQRRRGPLSAPPHGVLGGQLGCARAPRRRNVRTGPLDPRRRGLL